MQYSLYYLETRCYRHTYGAPATVKALITILNNNVIYIRAEADNKNIEELKDKIV